MKKKEKHVKDLADLDIPLVFLIDNINIYRGNKKYHRLFKLFGPKMWNFTGRGLLIPDISEIKFLFENRETSIESQQDIFSLRPETYL